MDTPTICPQCQTILLPNTNFCPKCGFQIVQNPQVIGIGRKVWIYFVSLFLPPLGLIWTFKYLRSDSIQLKRVALIATALTVISIVVSIWFTVSFFQGLQQQYNQIDTYQNLGI